jgi:hypothetical protein
MRDFNQTFAFSSQAAEMEFGPELNHLEAEIAREQQRVPAGLLAAAVLATLAAGKESEDRDESGRAADEAWLDCALEDSFPASDPISSNRYN